MVCERQSGNPVRKSPVLPPSHIAGQSLSFHEVGQWMPGRAVVLLCFVCVHWVLLTSDGWPRGALGGRRKQCCFLQ